MTCRVLCTAPTDHPYNHGGSGSTPQAFATTPRPYRPRYSTLFLLAECSVNTCPEMHKRDEIG